MNAGVTKLTTWCTLTALYVVVSATSSAQNANPREQMPKQNAQMTLQEVVVTANKRVQSIEDVGMTANVLGRSALENQRISSLSDIAQLVPGLSYSSSENNTPVFTLRGVGFNSASLAASPTVTVYIDQIPLPFSVLESQGAFDLQRVEVYKGPQGTLWGGNSTGGAVNFVAAKPTKHLAVGNDISYGRFNTVQEDAYLSGPINHKLSARVAIHIVHGGDWQQSYTRRASLGKTRVYAARGILDWNPMRSVRFALLLTGWQDKSDPQAGQLVVTDQQVPPGAQSAVTNYPFAPQNSRAADWSYTGPSPTGQTVPFTPFSNRRMYLAALKGSVDLPKQLTLTSLTSYTKFRQRQAVDYDGMALNDDDIPKNNGGIRSFYQELRVSSEKSPIFRWIVGANYQESTISEHDAITYSTASTYGAFNIYENGFGSSTYARNMAFYVHGERKLTRKVKLIAGARYTDSLTNTTECNIDLGDGHVSALLTGIAEFLTGRTLPPLAPGACISLNSQNIPGPPFLGHLHQHNLSWRGEVDYKPSRALLLYGSASRGYVAGSFPTISASRDTQDLPVKQEELTAYEVGFKSAGLARGLVVNGAIFYYDYKDKQIQGKELDPVFGVLNALINVPKSRILGAEGQLQWTSESGLQLGASVTYLDSRVQTYSGTGVLGTTKDWSGSRIPFAPMWEGAVNARYTWNFRSVSPFVSIDAEARSWATTYIGGESISVPTTAMSRSAVLHPFETNSYALVNLRAGVAWDDGHWHAELWGKNILNKYYWQNVIYAFDTGYRLAGRPATYGVSVRCNF